MESNRFELVPREHIYGSIGGVDFGSNISCVARSPSAALLWSGGGGYWSGRGSPYAYEPSYLIGLPRTRCDAYKRIGDEGGRLTAKRIWSVADKIVPLFDGDEFVLTLIAQAVKDRETVLIEGGGESFRKKP